MPQLIVIGGGPAGMMAAVRAAELGAKVILFEKMRRTGRKLCLTGAGRCNLTNTLPTDEFIAAFGPTGKFLRQALSQFGSGNLIELVERLGVPAVTEPNGRVYPASNRAVDVVNAFTKWLDDNGVIIKSEFAVRELLIENDRVVGVQTDSDKFAADAVIVATGGASYPETGSSGDGYKLAEMAGHSVVPIRPSLIPLETSGDIAPRLQGLSLPVVKLTIVIDEKKRNVENGELLFTHYGVSGPVVLRISKQVVDALRDKKVVSLSFDLLPDNDEHRLEQLILDSAKQHGKRHIQNILEQWLPSRLASICLELSAIKPDTLANQLRSEHRRQIVRILKDFRLHVSGHRPIAEAVVTAGGVDTREIDPRTMQSRLVKGLFFAGEVLDIDGASGGFNLQAAFSTGWVAGCAAAGYLDSP
ncbi:MAG: NAD(P)/FAD-dependent oxidoreductase [Candidatus Zixiibacteriota bacterium]